VLSSNFFINHFVISLQLLHPWESKVNMAIVVSDVNEGPVVNIAAWFSTTVMVLGVCTRIWSKYSALQRWSVDDALTIITMVRVPICNLKFAYITLIKLMEVLGLYNDCYTDDDGCKRPR